MITGTVVLKENHIQLITDQQGDIPAANAGGFGLYSYDTRHLNAFELLINGQRPLYLSHSAERNYMATFQFVNPEMVLAAGVTVPRQTISIRRSRFVDERGFHERLGFYNCNQFPVDLDVTMTFDCDFRDMFAVRGFAAQRVAGRTSHTFGPEDLVFSYVGRDHVQRHTVVHFNHHPEPLSADTVLFRLHLEPHTPVSIPLYVRTFTGRRRATPNVDFDRTLERERRSYEQWHRECTAIETDNQYFDRSLLRQSRFDIRALLEFDEGPDSADRARGSNGRGRTLVPSAGIPWYAVPFGRDAIITALQTLMYNPTIAEGTLRFLARYQGTKVDPATEEEPGKILHEIRRGELANLREIPHLPYYGSVDATPLFVVLFVETVDWLGSETLYRDILPHALRALEWIDQYGDPDGDGYIEYTGRQKGGVVNQGWKDSFDSLQYEDGQLALRPAALVEAQGYVYQAKRGLSRLVEAHGDAALAGRLRQEAENLRTRFQRDFWLEDVGFFAQGLDREKKPIRAVTSNVGHCLWSEILDADKAGAVVRRLLEPDMFSGWGIRTLSSQSRNYNPMSYHNGSVWPHDNSLIALGMRRYGFADEATTVISAMLDAGLRFPSNRLPELFCGFTRDRRFNSSPMAYIKSCSPQAWAAAAPFLFLQTLLDVRVEDTGQVLCVDPVENDIFRCYVVSNLCLGAGRASFKVTWEGGQPRVQLESGSVRLRTGKRDVLAGISWRE